MFDCVISGVCVGIELATDLEVGIGGAAISAKADQWHCSSSFHKRTREPPLPPPSAVISRLARGHRSRPINCHQLRMALLANTAVSGRFRSPIRHCWRCHRPRKAPPEFGKGKIVDPHRFWRTLYVAIARPPFLKSPTISFFLASPHRLI